MFWHRKNNADWMILLQVSEMIKNVFKNNIWEGKRKLENVFDIRDYIPREKTNYDTSGNLGITYRTRAIISRSLYFFLPNFHFGCGLYCRQFMY